jgi:hypothetical protein
MAILHAMSGSAPERSVTAISASVAAIANNVQANPGVRHHRHEVRTFEMNRHRPPANTWMRPNQ